MKAQIAAVLFNNAFSGEKIRKKRKDLSGKQITNHQVTNNKKQILFP
jgi:hypothetical protein